nr:UvrB/UvrC motif-containing protein [Chloroflexota bacterium]
STVVYSSERGAALTEADRKQIEAHVARMDAEMRSAAKQLEFERAAALRDEIQQIRLRVLEQDASVIVGRAAERAASGGGLAGAALRARGRSRAAAEAERGPAMEVTSVTVLPADEEPGTSEGTASDWLPGIRDEHDDDPGWQARWLDKPTWDRTVTPNVIKRTGSRPRRRR